MISTRTRISYNVHASPRGSRGPPCHAAAPYLSRTISTMRRPEAVAMRWWLASTAGIDEAPGSVSPIVSASADSALTVAP
jgi:hypothetical protein